MKLKVISITSSEQVVCALSCHHVPISLVSTSFALEQDKLVPVCTILLLSLHLFHSLLFFPMDVN